MLPTASTSALHDPLVETTHYRVAYLLFHHFPFLSIAFCMLATLFISLSVSTKRTNKIAKMTSSSLAFLLSSYILGTSKTVRWWPQMSSAKGVLRPRMLLHVRAANSSASNNAHNWSRAELVLHQSLVFLVSENEGIDFWFVLPLSPKCCCC